MGSLRVYCTEKVVIYNPLLICFIYHMSITGESLLMHVRPLIPDGELRDLEKVEKIVKSLSLKVLPRDIKSKDTRALLTTIFSQWLPLSTAVLVSVIEQLPSPPAGQKRRIPLILDATPGSTDIDPKVRSSMVEFDKSSEGSVVAYVSKMVAISEFELQKNMRQQLSAEEMKEIGRQKRQALARRLAEVANETEESTVTPNIPDPAPGEDISAGGDKERLIGFARLYSGTIKVGQELYVLGPKYNPSDPTKHVRKITVTELYYMMGRDLQNLDEVPAGNVFGIGGLEGNVLKNGTLCSVDKGGANLAGVGMGGTLIVRVAVEPKNPSELNKMIDGLKMLEQADPCAQYIVQDNGEHVILTAGELHLERCLKDLRERFAKIEIQSSAPIVPYRETIVSAADMAPPKEKDLPRGTILSATPSKSVAIKIQTRPLPAAVTEYLIQNTLAIKRFQRDQKEKQGANQRAQLDGSEGWMQQKEESGTEGNLEEDIGHQGLNEGYSRKEELGTIADVTISLTPPREITQRDLDENDALLGAHKSRVLTLEEFKQGLQDIFDQECIQAEREVWSGIVNKIAAFGPRRIGPNILVDATGTGLFRPLLIDSTLQSDTDQSSSDADASPGNHGMDLIPYLHHAFQLFTFSGPLCGEPLQGVSIFIQAVDFLPNPLSPDALTPQRIRGELLTLTQSALRTTFSDWSPRLLLAIYIVTILVPPSALGRAYTVITRRRGRILSEEMREGTPYFTITATLPVRESFGFSDELRKRTSGEAPNPQMEWGGYEIVVDEDPWWEPRTEEELEEWGQGGGVEREGLATVKGWVEEVRLRKGLFVQGRKLAVGAGKQKTLKK